MTTGRQAFLASMFCIFGVSYRRFMTNSSSTSPRSGDGKTCGLRTRIRTSTARLAAIPRCHRLYSWRTACLLCVPASAPFMCRFSILGARKPHHRQWHRQAPEPGAPPHRHWTDYVDQQDRPPPLWDGRRWVWPGRALAGMVPHTRRASCKNGSRWLARASQSVVMNHHRSSARWVRSRRATGFKYDLLRTAHRHTCENCKDSRYISPPPSIAVPIARIQPRRTASRRIAQPAPPTSMIQPASHLPAQRPP